MFSGTFLPKLDAVFIEASGEMIATDVASITFEITERAVPGGIVVAREFDIFGSPSGAPEVLLGDCNLVLQR